MSGERSIKLAFLTLLIILISGCDQPKRAIELEKVSDAYIIISSQNPVLFWKYPGARNLGNAYPSQQQDTPLFELSSLEPLKVEVINFYATVNGEKLFKGDDTFEIFEDICSKGEKGWRNNDTCYFRSGSKYHFVRFVKDEVEHKGWVARTYLFKDINGAVYVSPDSQGNTINLNPPRYSVSPELSASNTEYCTQLTAALMLDNLSDERRGEFETKDEFKNRIDNKRQLIETSGWKDKAYVTKNDVSLDYEIDSQVMSFKVYNDFPSIKFNGYGSYGGCETNYGLDFTARIDDRDYGLFSAKGGWDYADFGLVKKMDRGEAKLLKETLKEADKSIVLYTGIELISSKSGFDYKKNHYSGGYPVMEWTETKSVRRFIGDLKYFVMVNPLDNSLVAYYFSDDYIDNYLDNDINLLSISLGVDSPASADVKAFTSLLHRKYIE